MNSEHGSRHGGLKNISSSNTGTPSCSRIVPKDEDCCCKEDTDEECSADISVNLGSDAFIIKFN